MSATVEDFWRMVVEHNICTMVQLTADDPEAFKYWSPTDMPGSEVDFGAMKVTLVKIFIFRRPFTKLSVLIRTFL